MSHIESTTEVYLQLSKRSADLELLLDRLEEVYGCMTAANEKVVVVGQPVCVNHSNAYNRAVIVANDTHTNTVSVKLVDCGKVITVPTDDIKPLDAEFLKCSPFAFECQLLALEHCSGMCLIMSLFTVKLIKHCFCNCVSYFVLI